MPGGGSRVSSSFPAAPASTGQALESPDPCTKGSTKRRVNTTETTHPRGVIAKDHEDVRFFFFHYQIVKKEEKKKNFRGVQVSQH